MCSVVGYVGKNYSRNYIFEGLTRLEYRGYDSAGIVCLQPETNKLVYIKSQGGVSNLLDNANNSLIDGFIGMGHTRWSTHGVASAENAHPHFDCKKRIAVVHNGIIENHTALKNFLVSHGHVYKSQTDTETIAHFLEYLLEKNNNDLKLSAIELANQLEGTYACSILSQSHPNEMLLIRKRSPICIGCGDNEMFIASDVLAFAGKSNKVLFLPDESCALVSNEKIDLFDFSGKTLIPNYEIIDITWSGDAKSGFDHFMLKEIYEQKMVIQNIISQLKNNHAKILKDSNLSVKQIKELKHLELIGCGTSYNAGCIAKFFFEKIAKIKTNVSLASEIRYIPLLLDKKSLAIAISQSGETADTLEATRYLDINNISTIGMTNVKSSTLVRLTSGYLPIYAGPELAVASTKSFTAQVTIFYWLANFFAYIRGLITKEELANAESQLLVCAELLENTIEAYRKEIINNLAPKYAKFEKAFFLGRNISYPFAKESALKLQEISYIFTTACAAGELKHGPLALIDANVPVFIFSVLDDLIYHKLVSNAQEIKARSGHIIAFAFEGQQELIDISDTVFIIPKIADPLLAPLIMTGLMQFFVYSIAKVLDRTIDKPRNLAKSVTVE